MKFGRQLSELVDPKFRSYCVAYNMLKSFIHDADSKSMRVMQTIQDVTSAAVPYLPPAPAEQLPSVLFQEALTGELEKINTFSELENETLLTDLRAVVRRIRAVDADSENGARSLDMIRGEIDQIGNEICAFAGFVNINYTAFRKITKKEAKVHRTSSAAWFMANVARAPFMTVDFDRLLTGLSIVYELARSPQIGLACADLLPGPSPHRILSSWVSGEDLWDVKVALSRMMHLELVTQGGSRPSLIDSVLAPVGTGRGSKDGPVLACHKLRAVYLDTPWLEWYKGRVSGQKNRGFQVEIEGESAFISLPSGTRFTTSIHLWEQLLDRNTELVESVSPEYALEIKHLIKAGYTPLVECNFSRYVFKYEDDIFGTIQVWIEEDASFAVYGGKERLEDKNSKFPSHALYISVSNSSAPNELPDWLTEITGMPGVTEVANFSKITHGLFVFADNKIGAGVLAPSWAVQRPGSMRPRPVQPSPVFSSSANDVFSVPPTKEGGRVRSWLNTVKRMVGTQVDEKVQIRNAIIKIEPKSFFACERNLLDWTHTCVVVTGLAALQGGVLGHAVMGVPIMILVWETYLHRTRNFNMLNKEDSEYSDKFGPPLLLISLLALCLNLFLSAISALVM